MSIIDALEVLSDHQTIDGTMYSQRLKYVGPPNDWGMGGMPRVCTVISHGAFDIGATLELQLLGATKEDFSDAFVIQTTGSITGTDIQAGSKWDLYVNPTGKKYSFVCVKYIVVDVGDSATVDDEADDLCPTKPLLKEPEPEDNTFSAFFQLATDSQLTYPYANEDYQTA